PPLVRAGEAAARAGLALGPQLRLVQAEHVLDAGQAQAGAAALARAAGGHEVEALGESRQVLRCDALAGVGVRQLGAAVGRAGQADADAATGRGVSRRAANQVRERAVQLVLGAGQVGLRDVLDADLVRALARCLGLALQRRQQGRHRYGLLRPRIARFQR